MHGMWDLSSPTRDRTHTLYSGNIESQPLDHQGTSTLQLSYNLVFVWCVIFHPFTFSPFMSLYLKSMSCKCVVVLITFIQFDNLCFLERAFAVVSCVLLLVIPRTAAHQASLSFIVSWSLHTFTSFELVVLSNHRILCRPLLLLPSIFPSIRVFSNESALRIRWPKYWRFSFSISPSNEYLGLLSFRMDCKKCLVHLFCNKVIDRIEFNLPSCHLLSMFSFVFFL